MGFLDQLTPQLYSFVKRNRKIRDAVMPVWQFAAETFINIRSVINREEVLPAPKAINKSLGEWIRSAKAKNPSSNHSFIPLHPAIEVKRSPPKTIEERV